MNCIVCELYCNKTVLKKHLAHSFTYITFNKRLLNTFFNGGSSMMSRKSDRPVFESQFYNLETLWSQAGNNICEQCTHGYNGADKTHLCGVGIFRINWSNIWKSINSKSETFKLNKSLFHFLIHIPFWVVNKSFHGP